MFREDKKLEFSKLIVIIIGLIFILTLLEMPLLVVLGFDISSFATQQIVTTGSIFGAGVIFYMNKTKLINSIREKKSLIKWEWEFKESHKLSDEDFAELTEKNEAIGLAINDKIDNTIIEAINEDISIPNLY